MGPGEGGWQDGFESGLMVRMVKRGGEAIDKAYTWDDIWGPTLLCLVSFGKVDIMGEQHKQEVMIRVMGEAK